jgi:uncharacterized membrane protein
MANLDVPRDAARSRPGASRLGAMRPLVWLLFAILLLRFGFTWADSLAGASLPRMGSIGFTAIFAAFSLLHAADLLGWRRALLFLLVCVAVSWSFEAAGVATGMVYGSYHYGDALGAKIGAVPAIIPFAWFMMIYASWIVAHILLEGAGDPGSAGGALARAAAAAAAMTAWDAVMDPGMARAGIWTWENGGPYFGVPFQNFIGWMATTLTIYIIVALLFRFLPGRQTLNTTRLYGGAPVLAYSLVALDGLLVASVPELHVVAAFGICLVALLAILRLALGRSPIALPR